MKTGTKTVKPCVSCSKEFTSYTYKERLYCSMACWRNSQRGAGKCLTCGKEFTYKLSRPKTYCSRACHPGRKPTPENYITESCPVCGKEFTYHKSWPIQTCSRQCATTLKHPDAKSSTPCPECGKEFTFYKSWPRKYCSRSCAAKNSISNIPNWQPTAYQAVCEQCGKEFTTTPSNTRGRFCSSRCHGDWLREHAPRGEDHANWRGGYAPYYGANWRQQRRAARRRDKYTCQHCAITENELGKSLDVHHIRRFGDFTDYKEANKLKNLISLCPTCHATEEWSSRR